MTAHTHLPGGCEWCTSHSMETCEIPGCGACRYERMQDRMWRDEREAREVAS